MIKRFLTLPMVHTRMLLALSSLTWALFLLAPGHLFTPERTTYALMAAIADERIWGFLFGAHGLIALYTLIYDVHNKVTLALDGFLGCILWTASTTACFAAHWPHAETLTWVQTLLAYNPPAAMSGELWVAVFAWWHLITYWVEVDDARCG